MKRIIYNHRTNQIIAVASTSDTAHTIAETISYVDNKNAIYGLYGISIVSHSELCSTEEGRQAWNSFISNV
jgi:hypothetical protein